MIQNNYVFWERKYPEYSDTGILILSEDELNKKIQFYYPKQRFCTKRDIVYIGMNVQLILDFLQQ